MNAVIYARYSSQAQKEESIEGQLRVCTAYCERCGYQVVEHYIDRALSGRSDDRPDFQRMIRDSAKGQFDIVICYKMNRFARSKYDSVVYKRRLQKNGVKIAYACENIPDGPEGIILESVLEGIAEFYSEELRQNVNRGMYEKAMKCESVGGTTPYGYLIGADHKYCIDEKTAPIVKLIFDRWNSGESGTQIVAYLNNELGIRTRKGTQFNCCTINSILRNKRYTGVYMWREVEIEGGMPQIVSDEEFEAAQKRKESRKMGTRRINPSNTYVLTSKLYCGVCEKSMVGESGISGWQKEKYTYYTCLGRKRSASCKKANVRQDWLEETVLELTLTHILRADVIEHIIDSVMTIQHSESANSPRAEMESQRKEIDKGIANILKAIEAGMYSTSLNERLSELEESRSKLDISIIQEKLLETYVTREHMQFWFSQFLTGDPQDERYRMKVIDSFVNAIYLTDDEIHIVYNYRDGEDRVKLSDLPKNEKTLSNTCSDNVEMVTHRRFELRTP